MSKHRSIEARRSLADGHAGCDLSVEAYCAGKSIKVSSFLRWWRWQFGAQGRRRAGKFTRL